MDQGELYFNNSGEIFKHSDMEDEDFATNGMSPEKTIETLRMKVKELNSDISVLKRLIYMYVKHTFSSVYTFKV